MSQGQEPSPSRTVRLTRRRSIQGQLTALLMGASSLVVVVASVAFSAYTVWSWREAEVVKLSTLARFVARNTEAALAFNLPEDAQRVLASLAERPSVSRAAIFDRKGRLFAEYRKHPNEGTTPLRIGRQGKARFDKGHVTVEADILVQDEPHGWVVVEDDLSAVREALLWNARVMLGVLVGCLLLAWLVARRLQGVLSRPLLSLTETARAAGTGDWSVRTEVHRDDEIGLLADTFNRTLETIQEEIVERKRAEADLRRLAATLEQEVERRTRDLKRSNEELERFAYVASHDLQEPLRMVASFTNLLAQRYQGRLDGKADTYIHYASDGAQRMQLMLDDLLRVSRVGTQGRPPVPVAMDGVIKQVLQNLSVRLSESGGTVDPAPLPTVMGDETQLVQLLQNLVGNALKFCGDGTPRVRLRADAVRGPGPDDGPGSGSDSEWWRFLVEDNGIGIAPEHMERIFQIFQRLHGRDEYPGSGIGLALCKKIVERHGGSIWVTSTPGEGATFHFTLPAA